MGDRTALKGAEVVDLSALEGDSRHCDAAKAEAIRNALAAKPLPAVHWIDNGDCHYISHFQLEKVDEPFALLLIDHRPDMRVPADGCLSCDDWARYSFISLESLRQVLMVGIDPDSELDFLDLVFDGVLAVTDDDLRHCGDHLSDDVIEMISLLEPGIPVYVSIDKCVFSPDYAGCGAGRMTLEQVGQLLSRIAHSHRITGVDICGGPDPVTDTALMSFLESL